MYRTMAFNQMGDGINTVEISTAPMGLFHLSLHVWHHHDLVTPHHRLFPWLFTEFKDSPWLTMSS